MAPVVAVAPAADVPAAEAFAVVPPAESVAAPGVVAGRFGADVADAAAAAAVSVRAASPEPVEHAANATKASGVMALATRRGRRLMQMRIMFSPDDGRSILPPAWTRHVAARDGGRYTPTRAGRVGTGHRERARASRRESPPRTGRSRGAEAGARARTRRCRGSAGRHRPLRLRRRAASRRGRTGSRAHSATERARRRSRARARGARAG